MTPVISLAPLTAHDHTEALQQVYRATPHYWRLYALPAAPVGQAGRDLQEAAQTPGRYVLGIINRVDPKDAAAGGELIAFSAPKAIGMADFRLHWPQQGMAYIGTILVAEPYQRQGVGTQAWRLLAPWLAEAAGIETARLGVEQFNSGALLFFQTVGFTLTGASRRIGVGSKWVRLLYMEQPLRASPSAEVRSTIGDRS